MSEIAGPSSLMEEAIEKIKERFVEMKFDLVGSGEWVEIKVESSSVRSLCISTDVYFKRWLFFRKKILAHRYVLRLTHLHLPRKFSIFNEGKLMCELFLNDPHLRAIVQPILESLKDAPWFIRGIEYIDMSDSPLALYPRERSEFPKARLLNI